MRMEDCLSGDGLRKKGTGGPFAMGSGAFPHPVCVSPEVLLAEDGWHCGVPASGAQRCVGYEHIRRSPVAPLPRADRPSLTLPEP